MQLKGGDKNNNYLRRASDSLDGERAVVLSQPTGFCLHLHSRNNVIQATYSDRKFNLSIMWVYFSILAHLLVSYQRRHMSMTVYRCACAYNSQERYCF